MKFILQLYEKVALLLTNLGKWNPFLFLIQFVLWKIPFQRFISKTLLKRNIPFILNCIQQLVLCPRQDILNMAALFLQKFCAFIFLQNSINFSTFLLKSFPFPVSLLIIVTSLASPFCQVIMYSSHCEKWKVEKSHIFQLT